MVVQRSVLVLAVLAVAVVAGCTKAKPVAIGSSSNGISASAQASSSQSATSGATVTAGPTTAGPTAVSTSSGPATTIESGGCPTSALSIKAIRGSGSTGKQYAFIQFTNTSSTICSLTGFPATTLLLHGTALAAPAARSSTPIATVQIPPGARATAQLSIDSTCNAANSDTVQVIPPNRTDVIVSPLVVTGCASTIEPVTAG